MIHSKTDNEYKLLNIKYWKDIEAKPIFLDNTNINQLRCRNIAIQIFTEISILFEPYIYPVHKIKKLNKIIEDKLFDILEIDDKMEYHYRNYIFNILKFYLEAAIDYECYDVAANISKLIKIND